MLHSQMRKFRGAPRAFWRSLEHRRSFLDSLAKEMHLEPLPMSISNAVDSLSSTSSLSDTTTIIGSNLDENCTTEQSYCRLNDTQGQCMVAFPASISYRASNKRLIEACRFFWRWASTVTDIDVRRRGGSGFLACSAAGTFPAALLDFLEESHSPIAIILASGSGPMFKSRSLVNTEINASYDNSITITSKIAMDIDRNTAKATTNDYGAISIAKRRANQKRRIMLNSFDTIDPSFPPHSRISSMNLSSKEYCSSLVSPLWSCELFASAPDAFWRWRMNRNVFITWLRKHYDMSCDNSLWWQSVSVEMVIAKGGAGFVRHFRGSFQLGIIMDRCPKKRNRLNLKSANRDHENNALGPQLLDWKPWLERVSFWNRSRNRTLYLTWLGRVLGVRQTEQWYGVGQDEDLLARLGAGPVLARSGGSLQSALKRAFPEQQWQPWRFIRVSVPRFWESARNTENYLRWVSEQLGIKQTSDWMRVSTKQLRALHGESLIKKWGGLEQLLSRVLPLFQWKAAFSSVSSSFSSSSCCSSLNTLPSKLDKRETDTCPPIYNEKFTMGLSGKAYFVPLPISKTHHFLFITVQQLFQEEVVYLNYVHPSLIYSKSGQFMEFDISIPNLRLFMEYQGEHHYIWHHNYGPPNEKQQRDFEKKKCCQQMGFTLLEIPYWWNQTKDSLATVIHSIRPDLLREYCSTVILPALKSNTVLLQTTKLEDQLFSMSHLRRRKSGLMNEIVLIHATEYDTKNL